MRRSMTASPFASYLSSHAETPGSSMSVIPVAGSTLISLRFNSYLCYFLLFRVMMKWAFVHELIYMLYVINLERVHSIGIPAYSSKPSERFKFYNR
jgi:hypothetical protein